MDSYSSVEACQKGLHELADKIQLDQNQKLGALCLDLTQDINKQWGKVQT